jgi:hypothetical protein
VLGGTAELHGDIDMVGLRDLLSRVHAATGITLTTVQLRVEAIVEPDPTDQRGVSSFRHEMVFRFDELGLDLAEASPVTASPAGPVVVRSEPMWEQAADATEVGGVPRAARRWLLVSLLVLVAATAAGWPTTAPRADRSRERGRDPVPLMFVADVAVPEDRMRIRLAARADVERIARSADATMLVRDDGWCAVITERAMHWWSPDHDAPATPATSVTDVTTVMPVTDDLWAWEPPRYAEASVSSHDPEASDPPTPDVHLDAVDQLRAEMLQPRQPLFARTVALDRQDSNLPLRTTIDEIVAYLSEAAPRSR